MAEADAEDRDPAEKLLNVFDSIANWFRIARAIGKEDAIRFEVENILGRCLRRYDPHFAMMIDQQAQDILLDPEIVRQNTEFSRVGNSARFTHGLRPRRNRKFDGAFFPAVGLFATHTAGEFL